MNAQAEQASKRFPSKSELRDVFAKVAGDWAKLEPREDSFLVKTMAGAAVERKVLFSGRPSFCLVVRTTREFALLMGRLFAPGLEAMIDPEDAFCEVVNMYAGHLKKDVLGSSGYSAHLPEKSDPSGWPKKEADTACFLRVGAFPVEIMLWEMAD